MIGKNIRSLRHLYRLCEPYIPRTILMVIDGRNVIKGITVKVPNGLCIFNGSFKQNETEFHHLLMADEELRKLYEKENLNQYRCMYLPGHSISSSCDVSTRNIILLPETFQADLDKFCADNAKLIERLSYKYGIYRSDILFHQLYVYTNGSKNFFEWGASAIGEHGLRINAVRTIMQWYDMYPNMSKSLKKGTITAYKGMNGFLELFNQMSDFRTEKRINESISQFNTEQRKMLRDATLSETDRNALSKFSKLSEKKRKNFVTKMSSVTNTEELLKNLHHIAGTHFAWTKESFLEHLDNVDGLTAKIVYDNDGIILLQVKDYDTIKYIAKTTNWCISKNKSYWNNYINNGRKNEQYVIMDFSRKEDDNLSIVGFTITRNRGITSAHDFVNNNLLPSVESNADEYGIVSFLKGYMDRHDIYSILNMDGIDIDLVASFDKRKFEWNKESLFEFLEKHIDMDNLEVYKDEDNKLVIGVQDNGICNLFCDNYHNNIDSTYFDHLHVIFFDFNKKCTASDAMQVGIIGQADNGNEECLMFFSQYIINNGRKNFNRTLREYGLPYDIIKRPMNLDTTFKEAFMDYSLTIDLLKKFNKNKVAHILRNRIGLDSSTNIFISSVINVGSLDYIDMFSTFECSLAYFLDKDHVAVILTELYRQLHVTLESIRAQEGNASILFEPPTKKMIGQLYSMQLPSRNHVLFVCSYLAIQKIINMEMKTRTEINGANGNRCVKRMINYMFGMGKLLSPLNRDLIEMCLPIIEPTGDDLKIDLLRYANHLSNEDDLKKRIVQMYSAQPSVEQVATVTLNDLYESLF